VFGVQIGKPFLLDLVSSDHSVFLFDLSGLKGQVVLGNFLFLLFTNMFFLQNISDLFKLVNFLLFSNQLRL